MFFVIINMKFKYGDEIEETSEWDYKSPIGCYEDSILAREHAVRYAKEHGGLAMVICECDLDKAISAPKSNSNSRNISSSN